jgi:two-component system KDP operon response regulator KdpE
MRSAEFLNQRLCSLCWPRVSRLRRALRPVQTFYKVFRESLCVPFYVGYGTLGGERFNIAPNVICSTERVLAPYDIGSSLESDSHGRLQVSSMTVPSHPIHVLVVDDEPALRRVFRTSLAASGFVIEEARSGEEAVDLLPQHPFDLVLLDINMPGIGGVEACREIRALAPKIGILMVTVRDAEHDMVRALEAGADDYVTKPVRFRELVARMRAVLRRLHADNATEPAVIRVADLEIDQVRHWVRKAGEPVHLTPKEFELLALLMRNRGAPVTHAKLLRAIWGPEYGTELDYLRSFVRTLRKKIEDDPARPKYVLTEPWVGYRFCDPADPDSRFIGSESS